MTRRATLLVVSLVLPVWSALAAQATPADSALALFRQARTAYRQRTPDGYARAIAGWDAAALLWGAAGKTLDQARALDWGCLARREAGMRDEALDVCRRSLALFTAVDSTTQQGTIRIRLGDLHQAGNRHDSALANFRAALELARTRGNVTAEGTALTRLGVGQYRAGRSDSAFSILTSAAASRESAHDSASAAVAHEWLGFLEAERGNAPAAIDHFRRTVTLYAARGPVASERRVRRVMARRFQSSSLADSAMYHFGLSIAPDSAVTDVADEVRARRELADLLYTKQRNDSALVIYRAARVVAARGRDRIAEAQIQRGLGMTFDRLGQLDSAAVSLRASTALFRSAGDRANLVTSSGLLGMVEGKREQPAAAVAAFREALEHLPASGNEAARRTFHASIANEFRKLGQTDSMTVHRRLAEANDAGASSPESAIAAERRELARHGAAGDAKGVRLVTAQLAARFSKVGPVDSAIAWNWRSLALNREAHDSMPMAVAMLYLGLAYADRLSFDTARTQLRDAAAMLRAVGQEGMSLTPLLRVAVSFREEGQVDSAIAIGRIVLAGWHNLGNRAEETSATMFVAGFLLARSRFDSALVLTASALATMPPGTDPRTVALLHGVRGVAFSGSGRYDSSLVNIKRTVGLWEKTGDAAKRAQALGHVGSIYRQLGQFDSALTYHRQQRAVGEQLRSLSLQRRAVGLLAQDFESAGASDSAMRMYRESRELAARDGDAQGEAEAMRGIGLLMEKRGDADSAVFAMREALARARTSRTMRQSASGLTDLASLFDRAGERDSSFAVYQQARAMGAATGDRASETLALSALGRLEADRGHPEAGLELLRQALARERESGSLETSAALLGSIGHILRRLPRPDLAAAIAAFDTAAAYRTMLRQDAGGDENRLSIGAQSTLSAGEWELTWIARAPELGSEPAALGALAATERLRAQALLDLMRRTAAARAGGADLVAEGRRLMGAADRPGTAMLVYLVTEDTLITWYARPGAPLSVRTKRVTSDSIARLVGAWRRALRADGATAEASRSLELRPRPGDASAPGTAGALGLALARLLIPDDLLAFGRAQEIVIVPHASLALLPFGALPLGEKGELLGSRYALRYAPSLASLEEVERGPSIPAGAARRVVLKRALVVGNPVMPSARTSDGDLVQLQPLPAASREAQSVAARVGATMLTSTAASEVEVRRRMTDAPLIHLATHGYAYATAGQARNSFVALAPDAAADGLLTVGEVLDGPALHAELVVLSACQTGLGNLTEAEGTVGLQRAFLARGARSLLVSLWSVSDAATALLMERFYFHWLTGTGGTSKSEALRRAQADVRGTKGYEAPRFWAAFQLVGGR